MLARRHQRHERWCVRECSNLAGSSRSKQSPLAEHRYPWLIPSVPANWVADDQDGLGGPDFRALARWRVKVTRRMVTFTVGRVTHHPW
jgi:hypothetical protein